MEDSVETVTIATNEIVWMDSRAAAAHYGNVHYKTIERYARSGKVPGYFRFNRWYFHREELDAWMKGALHSESQLHRVDERMCA